MKLTYIKSFAALALFVGLSFGCSNDDHFTSEASECVDPGLTANKTVASLVASMTSTPVQYTSSTTDIIEGYVTSSDERGNFFKTVSMQTIPTDGSNPIGFTVSIDDTMLFGKGFQIGRKVYIIMNGLYFAKVNGALNIGALYNGGIGRLGQFDYKSKVIPSCTVASQEEMVRTVNITEAKMDSRLHTLIQIEDVQFAEAEVGKYYYDSNNSLGGATNRTLTDLYGRTLIFRTSSFASFSGNAIPDGSGTVRGVMTKYNSDYQFLARSQTDIMLDNPRLAPLEALYNETFTTNFPIWIKQSVTGAQVWTLDTTHGNPGQCAKMSGFAGGNNANEDWLISPEYDLTGLNNVILSYDTATNFNGNVLQVYISTNYSGSGAPSAATWTQLGGTLSPTNQNYLWTSSGPVNISSYAGQTVRVAFKYTSTTTASATWEVDNVKIIAN